MNTSELIKKPQEIDATVPLGLWQIIRDGRTF